MKKTNTEKMNFNIYCRSCFIHACAECFLSSSALWGVYTSSAQTKTLFELSIEFTHHLLDTNSSSYQLSYLLNQTKEPSHIHTPAGWHLMHHAEIIELMEDNCLSQARQYHSWHCASGYFEVHGRKPGLTWGDSSLTVVVLLV